MMTGVYTGTGAALDVDKVGFNPQRIEICQVTGTLAKATFINGMADASAVLEAAAGTKSVITTQGITPSHAGFSVGTNAAVNTAGQTYRYTCWD